MIDIKVPVSVHAGRRLVKVVAVITINKPRKTLRESRARHQKKNNYQTPTLCHMSLPRVFKTNSKLRSKKKRPRCTHQKNMHLDAIVFGFRHTPSCSVTFL